MDLSYFPRINASLNATAAVLLIAGYVAILRKRPHTHQRLMMGAFGASVLFLASYVTYHVLKQRLTGTAHTTFPVVGAARSVYLVVLISHLILALPVVPMALVTLYRGWTGRLERHVRIARWTLPVWLYVSVTGVLVYWMLNHLAPRLQ